MNHTQETPETLRRQVEETGGSQSLEPKPEGPTPVGGFPAPLTPPTATPSVGVPENLKALVEEILEEAETRSVPSAEEHQRRLQILSKAIRSGIAKSKGKIINYGGDPNGYLYLEAPRVFAIGEEARAHWGWRRLPNGRGYDHWKEDGVDIFYAEGWADCPMLDTEVGKEPGVGVGMIVTSEDKFMKGTLKSAGEWGHKRNLMRKAQTQAARAACVQVLGLNGITEAALCAVLGKKLRRIVAGSGESLPEVEPYILVVKYKTGENS